MADENKPRFGDDKAVPENKANALDQQNVDPRESNASQKSLDPVYAPSRTVGAFTDPSDAKPQNVSTGSAPQGSSKFAGYPQMKYHPMYGAREVGDPNEAASLPGPSYNWFDTPGEADMHRTDLEAQEVIHHSRRVKLDGHKQQLESGEPVNEEEANSQGIVRLSVQAQEAMDAGRIEPH